MAALGQLPRQQLDFQGFSYEKFVCVQQRL